MSEINGSMDHIIERTEGQRLLGTDNPLSEDTILAPTTNGGGDGRVNDEEDNEPHHSPPPVYQFRNGYLCKLDGAKETRLANFHLEVVSQHVRMDEGVALRRDFEIDLHLKGKTIRFSIPAENFCSSRLLNSILDHAGSEAITYCSGKELRIATQELSPAPVPLKIVTTSMGFTEEGSYLAPGMLITRKGIIYGPETEVDLGEGNFSKHLGFLPPEPSLLKELLLHLHNEFLQLKAHAVTYPLMGHIVLAPFASRIPLIGKQKPVLHLRGPSGSGKTFLGNLAASFYGSFGDRPQSWTSTANSIETEGFLFRDALMFIDDYKAGIVEPEKVVRVIQNSANSQGRARLNPGMGYKLAPVRGVRGLILSTGEDFIDIESVMGRTILLSVEPVQNLRAGGNCWQMRAEYRRLIPGILEWVLAQDDWPDQMQNKLAGVSESLQARVAHSSNGTRLLNNWALNAFGFELFVRYSRHLGAIEDSQRERLLEEYQAIMVDHIAAHTERLQIQEPVEVFFRVLGEKFATGAVRVQGFRNQTTGKMIGTVRDNGNLICLFPDTTLEVISGHFRSLGQRMPFSKETLRDALVREGLIIRSGPGRVTHQVRVGESRLQAWQFDAAQFRMRCGLTDI